MFSFFRRPNWARKANHPKARFFHPWLEQLEDRLTLSTTQAISVADPTLGGGLGNSLSESCSITRNGRYVAFISSASNLVPGDTNGTADIFVRDTLLGTTTRASTDSAGNQIQGVGEGTGGTPAIAVDGSGTVYVAFVSAASNLVSGGSNGNLDVYVKNLSTGVTTRVSTDSAGNEGNGQSEYPALAIDGSGTVLVAFDSFANNLVSGDTNGQTDVFVKNLSTGVTTRVSTDSARKPYRNGMMSDDGVDREEVARRASRV